ncbi:MAG TPA: hypothetical protein RMF84_07970 [Polyangiaceae bacterium LLY-WYZ-14_1]|nr:hypothetical protein [Polyangiaceae bacterium LLY-WYZ-14_1]
MHTRPAQFMVLASLSCRRSGALLPFVLVATAAWMGANASPARADFGAVARAYVLPATIIDRVDLAEPEHLAFTITLPATGLPSLPLLEMPSDADAVGNVIGLFGRGMDVGRLQTDDDLAEGRLFLQVRTKFARRQVQLRARFRFD